MNKLKITGQRGSWFAKVEGRDNPLPIMWADEMNKIGGKMKLATNWLDGSRTTTAHKRREFRGFFEPLIQLETEFVVAKAVDPEAIPREKGSYLGVFFGCVESAHPEIVILITDKIASPK